MRNLHRLELSGTDGEQLHLVVVRDGRGPVPVAARARLRLLAPIVAGIDVLPHVQRWRYESGDSRTRSRRYDRAVDQLADRLARHFWGVDPRAAHTTDLLEEDL
ncbi:hypothetical protein [Kineococcus indalonis]|uniref:hypothetical protein n=1 Tax=Kineococcus indalonis TaxID=2696566 RepID=UPI0014134F10|nr:hypothetical protein [Kineococcus indalonis]NAZ87582.1 hypothetical protein [Kineococcus indalonis]